VCGEIFSLTSFFREDSLQSLKYYAPFWRCLSNRRDFYSGFLFKDSQPDFLQLG
jgi:hypothetical protein